VHRAFSSNRYRAHRAFYRPPGLHQPHQVPFNLNKVILNRLRFCTIKGIAIGIFTITFECVVKFFADILLFHSHVLFRIQQVTRIFALPNDRRSRLQTQLRFICSIPCQSTIMKLSPCSFSGVGFREKSFTVPAARPRINMEDHPATGDCPIFLVYIKQKHYVGIRNFGDRSHNAALFVFTDVVYNQCEFESCCWPCGSVNGIKDTCKSTYRFSIARRWHGGSWLEHSAPYAYLIGPTAIMGYFVPCQRQRRDAGDPRLGAYCRFFF